MSNNTTTTDQDFFDPELSKSILDRHLKVSGTQSRLHSVRGLIALTLADKVACFNHQVFEQHVEDTYRITTDHHVVLVVVQSSALLHTKKKRVAYPSTAITNNKLQALLFSDWKNIRGKKDEKAFLSIQDLLMRVFITCSDTTRYQIEFDDSYWNLLFVDTKSNTSVEITVERD